MSEKVLLEGESFEKCSCGDCVKEVFNLVGTTFYVFFAVPPNEAIDWMDIKCYCPNPCRCSHGYSVSFENILNVTTEKAQTALLYHIDVFSQGNESTHIETYAISSEFYEKLGGHDAD